MMGSGGGGGGGGKVGGLLLRGGCCPRILHLPRRCYAKFRAASTQRLMWRWSGRGGCVCYARFLSVDVDFRVIGEMHDVASVCLPRAWTRHDYDDSILGTYCA